MADLQKLLEDIRDAAQNLVTMEIVTAVGQVKGGKGIDGQIVPLDIDWDKPHPLILTRIDLLQGDIKTVYDTAYVTGEFQSLRDFHAAREREGHEIVEKNLEALRGLYDFAKELLHDPQQ